MKLFALLKKQFLRNKSNLKYQDKSEIFSSIFKWLIYITIGIVLNLAIYVFAKSYSQVYLQGTTERHRLFELQSFLFITVFVIEVYTCSKYLYVRLFRNNDIEKIRSLPISKLEYIVAELIILYIRQFLKLALFIIPQSIVLGIVYGKQPGLVSLVGGTILSILVMPLMTVFISSLISAPLFILKKYLGQKYLLMLIVAIVTMGVVFYFYGLVLDKLKTLLITGEIQHLFLDQDNVAKILYTAKRLVPASMLASVSFGGVIRFDYLYIVVAIILCGVSSIGTTYLLYDIAINLRVQKNIDHEDVLKIAKEKNVIASLLKKEALTVLRNNAYAKSYFGVLVLLPLFVYMIFKMLKDTLMSLLFFDASIALAVGSIILFLALVNSFAGTAFSRDYDIWQFMRTIPCRNRDIVLAKTAFCTIISAISVLLTDIILISTKLLSWQQGIFVLLVCEVLAESQIIAAIKMDFDRPQKIVGENMTSSEIKTALIWSILGIVTAVVPIAVNAFYTYIKGKKTGDAFSYIFIFLVTLIVALAVVTYFFVSLKKIDINIEKNVAKMEKGKYAE